MREFNLPNKCGGTNYTKDFSYTPNQSTNDGPDQHVGSTGGKKTIFNFQPQDGVVLHSDPPIQIINFELPLPKITFYKKLHPDAITPKRSKDGDAGLDLFAREDIIIPSLPKELILDGIYSDHHVTKINTGIAIQLPLNHVGLIWDRSSMGSKLLKTLGGVIDETYCGPIIVCLVNLSFQDYHIKVGDRVAQLIIQKYEKCDLVETNELSETERKDGGFGSSGR